MAAAIYDIVVEQGADFTLGLQLKNGRGVPFDLTGVTATAQIRQNITDSAALADFDIVFDYNRNTGKFTLSIPASITEVLTFVTGEWDLKFAYANGDKKRILKGKVTLSRQVTRSDVVVP
jgi:hypothetical protein